MPLESESLVPPLSERSRSRLPCLLLPLPSPATCLGRGGEDLDAVGGKRWVKMGSARLPLSFVPLVSVGLFHVPRHMCPTPPAADPKTPKSLFRSSYSDWRSRRGSRVPELDCREESSMMALSSDVLPQVPQTMPRSVASGF